MKDKHKKVQSNQSRDWLYTLIAFAILQCIFIFFELISWMPNFREDNLFQKIYETKLFTEWFSPYSAPQLNMFTAVFAIALLLHAIIGATKNFVSRKQ